MTNSSNIERIVMRRVWRIRMLRRVVHPVTVATFVSAIALWGIGREVWVARIIENMPSGPEQIVRFYLAAFLQTRVFVQALSLLLLGSVVVVAHAAAHRIQGIFLRPIEG